MTRFNLPEIQFTEKSAQQIEADMVNRYKDLTGISLGPADPRRKFIQAIVPILAQQRSLIDFSGKQNLLGYAVGDYLDHIGAISETTRLEPAYATTTVRFTLSTSMQRTIPAGTRVTAGDGIFFATAEEATVEAQQTYADVGSTCTVPGVAGNGYLPGEINRLVDPLQWVQSVSNTTESEGGADAETDDAYAERIQQAPESFSVAGPDGAYRYWARTASQLIIDVLVHSPSPGVVEIRPLLQGGEVPGQEILDLVDLVCNDRAIRPLTDDVQVLTPEQVDYDISLTYWISTANASIAASIQSAVNQAVNDYKLWQKSKLGRGIDPSELNARIKSAGAKRVVVTLPAAYQSIESYQVAAEDQVTVTYGGLEND
jgi:phage-related baseplate assembly protein